MAKATKAKPLAAADTKSTVVSADQFEQALKDRAAELSVEHKGASVVPVWYLDPLDPENGKPIIGYLKEPNRMTKAAIADELLKSTFRGQNIALEASLLKDHSDPRLWSTNQAYDPVIFSAGIEAAAFVKIALTQFKKK